MADAELSVGNFELRNCVASGTVSQIWEVVEKNTPNQFAMKLLLEEAFGDPEVKAVLKHEFKVGKSLEHPNFVRFHQLEVTRDHAFFTMDYFRAPSLKAQIAADIAQVHARFKKLFENLILALGYMHEQSWLHRDIKPENILLNKSSETRLIDFSLSARAASGLGKIFGGKPKIIQGTRTYIAPETLKMSPPSFQTDMYSLGITMFETLVGAPPFTGSSPDDLLAKHLKEKPSNPSDINTNVTPEMDLFVQKLLAKKPSDRPADMKEMYAEFRNMKVFKEDPLELAERTRKKVEEDRKQSVDKRLDSRADAERTAAGIAAPARPPKRKPPKLVKEPPKQKQPIQGAGTPGAPQMPYGGYPQPGMPYPPYGYPGMPGYPPGAQYPQQPYPPGYPPGQPYPPGGFPPQQPGQYPPQQPGAPYPAQTQPPGPQHVPPGSPPPGSPQQPPPPGTVPNSNAPNSNAPQQATPQQPGSGQPPEAAPAPPPPQQPPAVTPQPPNDEDDMPFMTELPDIL